MPSFDYSAFLTQAAADARYQALGSLSSSTPSTIDSSDTGSAGVSSSAARADHEHPVSGQLVPTAGWTSYTPTLDQGGAVTKTVTYAKYVQLGKLVIAEVNLAVTGSGTGSNRVLVGPPPVTPATSGLVVGSGWVFDATANTFYQGAATMISTSTVGMMAHNVADYLGSAGFTAALASGDLVRLHFMYEAAS